ncbi:MAG: class II aldolase/adducin family protein [Candidatus Eisenbacteria sp.]|nr:class II aldolase/adducin family protein [Candidatus Eisenbacteria bacterium]
MDPFTQSAPWVGRVPPAILDEIGRFAGLLAARGWSEAQGGNISILLPAERTARQASAAIDSTRDSQPAKVAVRHPSLTHRRLVATCSGCRMRDLAMFPPGGLCFIKLDAEGRQATVEGGMPTMELPTHLAVHAAAVESREREGAILHTHPPALIALTHLESESPALALAEAKPWDMLAPARLPGFLGAILPEHGELLSGQIAVLPRRCAGGQALAQESASASRGHRLILWPLHGVLAWGETLAEALDIIETAEKAAEIALRILPLLSRENTQVG